MSNSPSHIRRQAARLLESAGVSREPVSLRDVVSALNLELVQKTREPFSCEAALEPMGDTRAVVLHGAADERRRRFTIAHEIGHFVLHPARVRPERGGLSPRPCAARNARPTSFAAELLMPELLVRQAVLEQGANAPLLADRFQVSIKAMEIRLRRLGVLPQGLG